MKFKTILACAVLGLVIFNGRLNAAVESDVVGYTTVTIQPGNNMVAVNFDGLDGASISIQELFPGSATGPYTAAAVAAGADQLKAWDAKTGKYTTYYLYASKKGTTNREYKWVDASATSAPADKEFTSGDSFWFFSRATESFDVTIAGSVSVTPAQEIEIEPGNNMIGCAFPMNFNPNSLDADFWKNSGAKAAAVAAEADQLKVWDAKAGKYTTYYLYASKKGTTNREWRWVDAASTSTAVSADSEVMPVAQGAWYYHRGAGYTLTIDSPLP